ncbi:MAG: peptidylprolyl isomerase [Candidatus Cryosericum sp.]
MSAKKRERPVKPTRAQELQEKYPGHRPIPPSKRTVVVTLVATVVLSLLIVFLVTRRMQPSGSSGLHDVQLDTSMGVITLELDGDSAPRTVAQFLDNVHAGVYDGLTFHRVVKGFMIQGGDPAGDGTGGGSAPLERTGIHHARGVISMASSGPGVTQSDMQFFILQEDASSLDGKYAAFGRVVDGMDVVDKIAAVPVRENPLIPGELSIPVDRVTILRATEVAHQGAT